MSTYISPPPSIFVRYALEVQVTPNCLDKAVQQSEARPLGNRLATVIDSKGLLTDSSGLLQAPTMYAKP
jgi:hypothetical protein